MTQGLILPLGLKDLFVPQGPSNIYASHSLETILVCSYTICSYDKSLAQFLVDLNSSQPCLLLYFFCLSMLHCLFNVLYFSQHKLLFILCCLLAIFALIELVVIVLTRRKVNIKYKPLLKSYMHNLDTNKMAREEARRQLHKNVASNIE